MSYPHQPGSPHFDGADAFEASHNDRAIALAAKITAKAESALDGILREMVIMEWPAEFRAIMWGAVVDLAAKYRDAAEADHKR